MPKKPPAKRPPGRPTLLTPEAAGALLRAIRAGNYLAQAAASAGVGERTLFTWLEMGRKGESATHVAFRQAVLEAEAAAETTAVRHWRKKMPKNWQACAAFLAARYPARWGARVKVTVEEELNRALDKLKERLPPEEYGRVLEVLAGGDSEEEVSGVSPGAAGAGAGAGGPGGASGGAPG